MSWALASLRHPGSSRRVLMAALASTFKRFESCSMHPIHGWQSETATRSPLPLLRQHPRCALRTSGTWLRSGVPVRHPLRAHLRGAAVAPPRSRQCIVHAVGGHGSLTSMPSASAAPAAVPDNHELLLGHQLGEYAVHWACRHTLFDSFRGIRARRCCASRNKHP
jgi:hypothetical protein